ncbi:hypothetical protein BH23GEM11_BH23GEM11_03000 [soil metagenome]
MDSQGRSRRCAASAGAGGAPATLDDPVLPSLDAPGRCTRSGGAGAPPRGGGNPRPRGGGSGGAPCAVSRLRRLPGPETGDLAATSRAPRRALVGGAPAGSVLFPVGACHRVAGRGPPRGRGGGGKLRSGWSRVDAGTADPCAGPPRGHLPLLPGGSLPRGCGSRMGPRKRSVSGRGRGSSQRGAPRLRSWPAPHSRATGPAACVRGWRPVGRGRGTTPPHPPPTARRGGVPRHRRRGAGGLSGSAGACDRIASRILRGE